MSRTGLAVVDGGGGLLHVSSSKPPFSQRSSILSSGASLSTSIAALSREYSIAATLVEDFLQTFEANSSSSHTRFTLARVNGIAAYESWRHTSAPVLFAYPTSMRSYFEIERAPPPGGGGKGGRRGEEDGGPSPLSPATTAARARVASRARGKWAVKEFAQSIHGDLQGRVGMKDDEVDAILAAMYCLVQEVEWRVLNGDGGSSTGTGTGSSAATPDSCVFEALLDAKLPSARLGKAGVSKGGIPLEVVRGALLLTHQGALGGEATKRAMPWGEGKGLGGVGLEGGEQEEEGGGGLPSLSPAPKRKATGKAGKGGKKGGGPGPGGGGGTTGIDPTDLLRLYKRQRTTLTQEIKHVLLGKAGEGGGLLPWGRTNSSASLPPA
jgi:hypothetical protein